MTTSACCGILRCVPSGCLTKPKPSLPITAPSCTTTRWPIDDALANRDVRVHDAVVADARARTDDDVGIDDGARADRRAGGPIVTNGPIDTSGPSVASGATALSGSTPFAGGVACTSRPTACANARYGFSLRRTAHAAGAAPGPAVARRCRCENDGGRARLAEQRDVARIRDEGEVAGARVLDAGDAADLDVAVPLEAAVQLFGDVAQLQCFNGLVARGITCSNSRAPCGFRTFSRVRGIPSSAEAFPPVPTPR